MREYLITMGRSCSNQARAAWGSVALAMERARSVSAGATSAAMSHITPALRWTGRQSKRAAIGTLVSVENVLLSPRGRDRVHAVSVFALIFGFAVLSVDMIITGGPELVPSAQAASAGGARINLIAATTQGGAEPIEFAQAEPPTTAREPEANSDVRAVRLASVEPPSVAGAMPDLLDAAEPIKAEPAPPADHQQPIKAGAEAA